jgi:starch synthase
MRVLFASSEVFPLIKTGGLADVCGALPAALMAAGMDVRILMPGYPEAMAKAVDLQDMCSLGDPLKVGAETRLISAKLPNSAVPVWFLDCPQLFDRPGGPYLGLDGRDHADNALRFGLLSWAAAMLCTKNSPVSWRPQILHAHDWQAGLAAAYLEAWKVPDRPGTLFTIHNIAYQGQFPKATVPRLGLPWEMFHVDGLEYYDSLSFLKAGLIYSDRLSTVSRRYAKEIQSAPFGCGMEGLLAHRAAKLVGILNGADYSIWTPEADSLLEHPYASADFAKGKAANKAAVQAELGLEVNPTAPLLIIVSRLAAIKGMDLVLGGLPAILREGAQLAVLGSGEKALEDGFIAAAGHNPRQVAVNVGYSEQLAHRLMAGGDVLVMPSRFEPCGLTQLYAFRYGTVPLVHATGGLADTVVDTTYDSVMTGTANGFVFEHANGGAFQWCVERALVEYRKPEEWSRIQMAGIAQDFGWNRSAARYVELYRSLAPQVAKRRKS